MTNSNQNDHITSNLIPASEPILKILFSPAVIVVALGYFVDIFDLTLFNMLRVQSLIVIGVPSDQLINAGILLINFQMAGMLLGGILWGILGDKKGRLKVLFSSILLYSLANLANAFVDNVQTYALLRLISGIGLAGELGAGITLISEILPKEYRGLGTTLVATIGVFGATFGAVIVEHFSWTTCYLVGGSLGLLLLLLRMQVSESKLFQKERSQNLEWGNFLSIFSSPDKRMRFYHIVMIGVPIWFIAGLVMAFSPEIAQEMKVTGSITSAKAIGISYLGLGFGDLFSGLLSQKLKSRKKSIFSFLLLTVTFLAVLLRWGTHQSPKFYYILCFMIGFGAGFWAIFITVAAEQFGTNLRATVATSVPNFVRGSVIPMTLIFKSLKPYWGILLSIQWVGILVFSLALTSLYFLKETFHRDLDFFET